MGDKFKLMRPKAPRVGDKGETSVNSCGPRNPCGRQVWETNVGDKCKLMRPKASRVGDKRETSVNSCGPWRPEWETRGRQVTSVNSCGPRHRQGGDKCKLMRPKAPRVGDKGDTNVQGTQSGKQMWETRQVGDKCKLMRPKAPRVGDKGR